MKIAFYILLVALAVYYLYLRFTGPPTKKWSELADEVEKQSDAYMKKMSEEHGYYEEDVFDNEYSDDPSPPEVDEIAVKFVQLLFKSDYESAYELFTDQLKEKYTPQKIEKIFTQLTEGQKISDIEAMEGYAHVPNDQGKLGSMYVAFSVLDENGDHYRNEAVMVDASNINGTIKIHCLEWGRP
ncbi:MAG: DUF3887 domain-containing protein [Chromatiales bacterium]|nr:DUF3887 domain-containing protein [Chromatiales bacterium]